MMMAICVFILLLPAHTGKIFQLSIVRHRHSMRIPRLPTIFTVILECFGKTAQDIPGTFSCQMECFGRFYNV